MARVKNNFLLKRLQGHIGKEIVIKQYEGKTVVSKYPDMSHIKPSKAQKAQRKRFAEAVAYARQINNSPALKKAYAKKVKKGQTVYLYALQEFLKKKAG